MKNTNMPSAPWYIVDAKSKKWTEVQILETLTRGIEIALSNHQMAVPLLQNVFPLKRMPLLAEIPLDKQIGEEEYKKRIKAAAAAPLANCTIVCTARKCR